MADDLPPPPGYVERKPQADVPPPTGYTERPQQELRSSTVDTKPIIDDRGYGATNFGIARASLPPDVHTQIKRFAEHFGVPESFFGVVNGEIVRWVPEEKAYAKVVPTVSGGQGVAEKLKRMPGAWANQAGDSIPAAAGAVAGTLSAGPASVPLAAGAAGAADLARQGLDKAISGEPVTALKDYSYSHAAGEAVAAGAGQLVGLGIAGLGPIGGNPMKMSAVDRLYHATDAAQKEWATTAAEAERRGVDLSVGQTTGLKSLMRRERQLGKMDETADTIDAFQQKQRTTQIPNAFKSELDTIAPAAGREQQIGGFRDAAGTVIDQAVKEKQAIAKPAFATALDTKPPFYTSELDPIMKRPMVKEAWAQAQKNAANESRVLPEFMDSEMNVTTKPDWRAWEDMKRGFDDVIKAGKDPMTGAFTPDAVRAIKTKQDMMHILDAENPAWAKARAMYGESAEAVDILLDGGVGFIKNMGGQDRQAILNRVFGEKNLLPGEVTRMRQQFDKAGLSADWNNGVRGFLEGKLEVAMKPNELGDMKNVAGKLYSGLWGDETQRKVLTAALGNPGQVESMNKLMNVVRSASRSLPEGSSTSADTAAMSESQAGNFVRGIVKTLNLKNFAELGDRLLDMHDALRTASNRQKLAEYMLSPTGIKDLSKIGSMSEKSLKAVAATVNLGVNAGIISLMPPPKDFRAPAANQ